MTPAAIVTADPAGIARASAKLLEGQPVGMPTETVYGLAADATNSDAVARLYAIKNRPNFNPLITHVATTEMARSEGVLDERAESLAKAFWPGPLTLVVPAHAEGHTCELARAGLTTIALRVPAHPVAQALLKACNKPLAAPSANPSGQLSPTEAQHVANEIGAGVALVLDGGRCTAGIESTIVAVLPGEPLRLLRPGAIAREAIEALVGPLSSQTAAGITAPGQLDSHYAPRARLRLQAQSAKGGEQLLAFGPAGPSDAINLSPSGDLVEAAANLYRLLRQLDATGAHSIAVMPIPREGLGEAINDRLRRAAAPRS